MSVSDYAELLAHRDHRLHCAVYGDADQIWEVVVECGTCGEILFSFENPDFAVNDPAEDEPVFSVSLFDVKSLARSYGLDQHLVDEAAVKEKFVEHLENNLRGYAEGAIIAALARCKEEHEKNVRV